MPNNTDITDLFAQLEAGVERTYKQELTELRASFGDEFKIFYDLGGVWFAHTTNTTITYMFNLEEPDVWSPPTTYSDAKSEQPKGCVWRATKHPIDEYGDLNGIILGETENHPTPLAAALAV